MPPKKACHNCRRSRLRCDQSLPSCNKCIRAGKECLGYEQYFSWVNGVASRGKMVGKSFDNKNNGAAKLKGTTPSLKLQEHGSSSTVSTRINDSFLTIYGAHLSQPIIDPFFQDLDQNTRFYLSYFDSHVCKDLVIYDKPYQNPFRNLIPFAKEYTCLLHIILATSAFHHSNALVRHSTQSTARPLSNLTVALTLKSESPLGTSPKPPEGVYQYALIAKQRALRFLSQALDRSDQTSTMVTLACVLLFIELELIDSGKNNWRPHVEGSRKLMEHLVSLQDIREISNDPMLDSLVSGCLVYEILGKTLTRPVHPATFQPNTINILPLLKGAEMNHYLSCPGELLEILQVIPELQANSHNASIQRSSNPSCQADHSFMLLQRAQKFDVPAWAAALRYSSPRDDWEKRVHIGSAHKAAVCIYIIESLRPTDKIPEGPYDVEHLVSEICNHVSFIHIDDDLMKSTCWCVFVAGAATTNPERMKWTLNWLNRLSELLPWNYVKGAIGVLETIWDRHKRPGDAANWVQELKVLGVDWLIC